MSNNFCAPGPTSTLVENISAIEGDPIGPLTQLLHAEDLGRIRPEDARWGAYSQEQINKWTGAIHGLMGSENIAKFLESEGYRTVDKVATAEARKLDPTALPVYEWGLGKGALSDEQKIYRSSWMVAGLKNYIESQASGTRDLAETFLSKLQAGEAGLSEGLRFVSEMQSLSKVGAYVLGWDQGIGRGLQIQGQKLGAGRSLFAGSAVDELKSIDSWGDLLKSRTNIDEYANEFERIAAKLNADPATRGEAMQDLIKFARRVKFAESPLKITPLTFGAKFGQKFADFIMYNGLLSSPATMVVNTTSALWAVARPIMQLGAAHAYALTDLPGQSGAQRAILEASAALTQINSSYRDAMSILWQGARTGHSLYSAAELGLENAPINSANAQAMLKQFGVATEGKDWFYDMVDFTGQTMGIPSRILAATDDASKHMAIRGKVAAMGVEKALASGISPMDTKAIDAYIQEYMETAFNLKSEDQVKKWTLNRSVLGEADFSRIMADAEQATFQEANGMATAISRVVTAIPGAKAFVPFVRTPLNILRQGFVDGTGMGALMKLHNASRVARGDLADPALSYLGNLQRVLAGEFDADPGAAFRVAGQIGLTTALAGTFYTMAMNGQLVGGGPQRWNPAGREGPAQKAWEAYNRENGIVPYSIGGVPFARFGEPIAIVLRMAADMGMYASYAKDEDREGWLAAHAGIMVSSLYDATFFTGLENLINTLDPRSTEFIAGTNGGRSVQNYVATYTPFGGMLNFIDKTTDPNRGGIQKDISALQMLKVWENTFTTGILAKVADRVPGIGQPALVDQLTGAYIPVYPGGGPEGLNPFQVAIPFLPRGGEKNPGPWTAVWEVMGEYQEKRPAVQLTIAEQQKLNFMMANIELDGKTVAQAIMEYRNRPDVRKYVAGRGSSYNTPADLYSKELNSIINSYQQAAFRHLADHDSSIGSREALLRLKKGALSMGDQATAGQASSQMDELYRLAL